MKKIFLIMFSCIFLLCGCKRVNEDSIKKDLTNYLNKIKGYHLVGKLEVYNGDNSFKYDVTASKYKNNYRVSLVNKNNKHEQIIIRNNDGVYVLNPSLNKSYKFQSNWPENSSQIYFLESIISDITNDNNMKIINKKNGYILECKLAFTNNKNLFKEKVYFDSNMNLKKVEVFDENKNLQMLFEVKELDKKAVFNDDYFDPNENMNTSETEETMNEIDDTIYPMYLPSGTYLSNEENVNLENGERVILTFAGETPFIMVQETVDLDKEEMSVSGDPEFIVDTVGAISDNSIEFISNGISYYISSDSMNSHEMMQVAESLSPITVMK